METQLIFLYTGPCQPHFVVQVQRYLSLPTKREAQKACVLQFVLVLCLLGMVSCNTEQFKYVIAAAKFCKGFVLGRWVVFLWG